MNVREMKQWLLLTSALATVLLVSGAALQVSAQKRRASSDEAQIRALYTRYIKAFNHRDVATIMSGYESGPGLFVFDATPPRQHVGWEDYRKDWQDLFAAYPGPLHDEVSDLHITTYGHLAYGHHIETGYFTRRDGSRLDIVVRVSDVYRKIRGKWLIVGEHVSAPVDIGPRLV